MAFALHHPQLDFHARPVTHAPSPLGFGFGLSSASNTFSPAGFGCATASTSHSQFQHLAHAMNSATSQAPAQRSAKRRHEGDDESESDARSTRDVTMDRSPTPPDRPRRGVPKRARMTSVAEATRKDEKGKTLKTSAQDDVDVGVLLASLPPTALLPILTSLLGSHHELKHLVLPLIPRPTLDAASQAVAASAKKLRDAYPYSNASSFSTLAASSSSVGFGSAQRPSVFSSFGSGSIFGAGSTFGAQTPAAQTPPMRDDYVLSRLAPHIADFISTCMSYLPYFSHMSVTPQEGQEAPSAHAQAKEKAHPNETFQFLATITNHLLSQPPLTRSSLAPQLLPRLVDEWMAWINRIDSIVNREGGMFGHDTVRHWEQALDEYAGAKDHGLEALATVRDRWVASVGWLVGRQLQPMQ